MSDTIFLTHQYTEGRALTRYNLGGPQLRETFHLQCESFNRSV